MVAFLIMEKVTVYIDGFNFYYGLRTKRKVEAAWAKAYWVDLVKFFEMFLGENQELTKVVYFTASPLNKEKSSRQSSFLNANKLLNGDKFEIVRGKYLEKKIVCPNCKYTIIRPEEKKTDVNISIRMITDCFQEKTDSLILVSGDSDLLPPIEFIQKNLGGKLDDTVIIVATSDDSALMRKYGAFCAMSVAEYFKEQGKDVLFIMDSVTRFAMAQREIGLALGEPPTTKGYPPSVLSLLPQLMERTGKEEGKGTITAFFTVLVDGDDMSDPIADQSRSIIDGHIVLSRELTDFGIYPPINIQNSASRVMNDIISEEHKLLARKFKRLNSLLKENEVLLRIGAYQKGSDKELDMAIAKKVFMQ